MSASQEIQELYQAVILDHNKNPKNFRKIEHPSVFQEGYNPLCGDHLRVYANVEDGKITDLSFEGEGCAISKASASMMTQTVKGMEVEKAKLLFDEFHNLLTGKLDPEKDKHNLGKLKIFAGIWKYPARVKCASLCWHTLKTGLEGKSEVVKTE